MPKGLRRKLGYESAVRFVQDAGNGGSNLTDLSVGLTAREARLRLDTGGPKAVVDVAQHPLRRAVICNHRSGLARSPRRHQDLQHDRRRRKPAEPPI
jgi:hypothetical protein